MDLRKMYGGEWLIDKPGKQEEIAQKTTAEKSGFFNKFKKNPTKASTSTSAQVPTNVSQQTIDDATREYQKLTTSKRALIINNATILLGIACGGLTGLLYANKVVAYKKAVALAEYNAKIAEAQKSAVEAIHQSALKAMEMGNPLFDNNDYGSFVFPDMDGKFSQFATENPELAAKIVARAHSHQNQEVLDAFAKDRGFKNYEGYQNWINDTFGHLFNPDGTLSSTATMQDVDNYYYTYVDLTNYLSNDAISFYGDEILKAGIDPNALKGAEIISQTITDENGNLVTQWSIDLPNETIEAMSNTNFDFTDSMCLLGISVLAGIGGYYVAKSIVKNLPNKNSTSTDAHVDEPNVPEQGAVEPDESEKERDNQEQDKELEFAK